jgi:hypothetical protein
MNRKLDPKIKMTESKIGSAEALQSVTHDGIIAFNTETDDIEIYIEGWQEDFKWCDEFIRGALNGPFFEWKYSYINPWE